MLGPRQWEGRKHWNHNCLLSDVPLSTHSTSSILLGDPWLDAGRRFSVPDLGVPDAATMNRILDAIDAALVDGMPVYVHCWGGIGRTGTVVGCFLVRQGLADPGQAIERIHDLRYTDAERHRPSPETRGQVEFVRFWDRHEKIRLR